MQIVVAGGTGLLGRAITSALLGAGHEVTIASRSRPKHGDVLAALPWRFADVTNPASLPEAVAGAAVVVDAVQFPNSPIEDPSKGLTFERIDLRGTCHLVDAARAAGASLFIGLSGVGAHPDAPYHWLRFKWEEEQYIKASGIPYVIFRPSWIYGPGDVSLNRFLGFTRWLPFVPVIGDGKTRINPLFINDIGRHVAAAIGREDIRNRIFEIGGPEVVTMDDVIRAALQAAGKRRMLLHSPRRLMKAVGAIAARLPGRLLTPDAIDFITMDGVADTAPLSEAFGLPLTPLAEGLPTYLG